MGLFNILNGMANGPRGNPQQSGGGSGGGGMSTMTMGLLALLAYKAYQSGSLGNILGSHNQANNNQNPTRQSAGTGNPRMPASPGNSANDDQPKGGLGDWLGNILGGVGAGGAAGSIINGGLEELVKRFQKNGYGSVADSWVKTGQNAAISPNELSKAAGSEDLDTLARELGMSRDQLLSQLSNELPRSVDQLTPDGRLPNQAPGGMNASASTSTISE